jgi:NAD(P)H-dependent FMN reductase
LGTEHSTVCPASFGSLAWFLGGPIAFLAASVRPTHAPSDYADRPMAREARMPTVDGGAADGEVAPAGAQHRQNDRPSERWRGKAPGGHEQPAVPAHP